MKITVLNIESTTPRDAYAEFIKLVDFDVPEGVGSREEKERAAKTLNKATVLIAYFGELEAYARILKREAKADREKKADYERLLAVEDVCRVFKEIAGEYRENIAKLITIRRLEVEEIRNMAD